MGEEAKQSIQDNQILPEHLQKTKKKKKKRLVVPKISFFPGRIFLLTNIQISELLLDNNKTEHKEKKET